MNMKQLLGMKIAVLVASGFEEEQLTVCQRALTNSGGTVRIISSNQGLVNGWDKTAWGHNHAVDAQLNTALGVDYDALIVPGGRRSAEKLILTAHTKRFIGSFVAAHKPLVVFDESLNLLNETGIADEYQIATDQNAVVSDNNLLTVISDSEKIEQIAGAVVDHFVRYTTFDQAA